VLYPTPQRGQNPLAKTVLSKMNATQEKIFALGLERYRNG